MTSNFKNEEYSGSGKFAAKKTSLKNNSNLFRLDNLPEYPAAEAYNKIILNEQQKEINHLFYDLSDKKHISLLILTDTHWGSISSHFMATIYAQVIAKYNPFIYLGYNGDNRNNNINTRECVGSSLDNALIPTIEQKLLYEQWTDSIIQHKTLFINSGNHENGPRTVPIGVDLLATFFAGTPYWERYSRYATLMTIRLKADNKLGYEDIKIYIDHGTSLCGGDGTKLDQGMKLAQQFGARIAIFGHVHQDLMADYRIKRIENGNFVYDDLSVVILPAPMGSETYALDKRLETPPSDLKLINIGTKSNDYLFDSTQRERRTLDKTSVYCDVTTIPTNLWKFGMEQAQKMQKEYLLLKESTNIANDTNLDKLISTHFKGGSHGFNL
jgi:predicted phosphodiesterase